MVEEHDIEAEFQYSRTYILQIYKNSALIPQSIKMLDNPIFYSQPIIPPCLSTTPPPNTEYEAALRQSAPKTFTSKPEITQENPKPRIYAPNTGGAYQHYERSKNLFTSLEEKMGFKHGGTKWFWVNDTGFNVLVGPVSSTEMDELYPQNKIHPITYVSCPDLNFHFIDPKLQLTPKELEIEVKGGPFFPLKVMFWKDLVWQLNGRAYPKATVNSKWVTDGNNSTQVETSDKITSDKITRENPQPDPPKLPENSTDPPEPPKLPENSPDSPEPPKLPENPPDSPEPPKLPEDQITVDNSTKKENNTESVWKRNKVDKDIGVIGGEINMNVNMEVNVKEEPEEDTYVPMKESIKDENISKEEEETKYQSWELGEEQKIESQKPVKKPSFERETEIWPQLGEDSTIPPSIDNPNVPDKQEFEKVLSKKKQKKKKQKERQKAEEDYTYIPEPKTEPKRSIPPSIPEPKKPIPTEEPKSPPKPTEPTKAAQKPTETEGQFMMVRKKKKTKKPLEQALEEQKPRIVGLAEPEKKSKKQRKEDAMMGESKIPDNQYKPQTISDIHENPNTNTNTNTKSPPKELVPHVDNEQSLLKELKEELKIEKEEERLKENIYIPGGNSPNSKKRKKKRGKGQEVLAMGLYTGPMQPEERKEKEKWVGTGGQGGDTNFEDIIKEQKK